MRPGVTRATLQPADLGPTGTASDVLCIISVTRMLLQVSQEQEASPMTEQEAFDVTVRTWESLRPSLAGKSARAQIPEVWEALTRWRSSRVDGPSHG